MKTCPLNSVPSLCLLAAFTLFVLPVSTGKALSVHDAPATVKDKVEKILYQIEGPTPRWEPTATETKLRRVLSGSVGGLDFDTFITQLKRIATWIEEDTPDLLERYIRLLEPHTRDPDLGQLYESLTVLTKLVRETLTSTRETTVHRLPPTISAAPEGATISGRVQAQIEGHWNTSFPDGLVFALSSDANRILGFSYTSAYPQSGYFRIDGLPMRGDLILVAFLPQVKRLHWMGVVTMDEVVDASKRHDSYSVGTVTAYMRRPDAASPHDLSGAGTAALKGAGYALQLMVLAGWVSQRAMDRHDFSAVDELTNRLYGFYLDGIEKHIVKARHAGVPPVSHSDVPVRLNAPYEVAGTSLFKLHFMSPDGDELIAQQDKGNVVAPIPYGYGINRLERTSDGQAHTFRVQWKTGKGVMSELLRFGRDRQGRYYVDYTCDACDMPTRYFSTSNEGTEGCGPGSAAQLASNYFAPVCDIDPVNYNAVATLDLNRSGRLAYIFASCAGPETRGAFTYVIIERRVTCEVIGSFSSTDPYPEISIDLPGLPSGGGRPLDYAKIYPLVVSAAGVQTRYEFDVSSQKYRQVATRTVVQQERTQDGSQTASPVPRSCPKSVTDKDGNSYPVIMVGDHCWMARNLVTSRYRNGDRILNVSNSVNWSRLESGAWAYYDNSRTRGESFGKLYNGYAARDRRGVCPDGWQVPVDNHWNTVNQGLRSDPPLRNQALEFLESLKEQPGGGRFFTGSHGQRSLTPAFGSQTNSQFNNGGQLGMWWGSLDRGNRLGSTFNVNPAGQGIIPDANHIAGGFAIRCVMPAR